MINSCDAGARGERRSGEKHDVTQRRDNNRETRNRGWESESRYAGATLCRIIRCVSPARESREISPLRVLIKERVKMILLPRFIRSRRTGQFINYRRAGRGGNGDSIFPPAYPTSRRFVTNEVGQFNPVGLISMISAR